VTRSFAGAFTRGAVILALAALAGSCAFWRDDDPCESAEEYQQAESAPEIVVPPGLDAPDSDTAMVIPAGPLPDEPLAKNAACLQRPPNYFDRPLRTGSD
jgi:uncharacterized lipoprotein